MTSLKALVAALGLAAAVTTAQAADKTLTIGTNNWAENIAVSHMWQQLLAEKGYDVKLDAVAKSILFSGLATGDIDVSLEIWLPNGDAQYLKPYQQDIGVHDAWYEGAQDELVVPSYVKDVTSIADLKAHADAFDYQGRPTVFGIEPGAAIADETDDAIKRYNLPFRQLNSSEAAMLASLKEAYRQQQPIAVTLWQPHWAYAQYDLKALKDPEGAYGGGDDIKWMSHQGFAADHPDVTAMLDAWHMSHAQLADLMLSIEKAGDPDRGVKQWVADHRELVDQWLNAKAD